jgi:hypothetical protein
MRRSSGSAASRSATPFWIATAHCDRVDGAWELDQRAVACELDDAAPVLGDERLDELLAYRLQARDRAGLVGAHEPAVADHVRGQNRRQLAFNARCGHGRASYAFEPRSGSPALCRPSTILSMNSSGNT